MPEADVVARSTDGPVTRAQLVRDFNALGVKPGMLLMVHSAMSNIGWVPGGVETVVKALRDAVGEEGTLMMPGFSGANTDPANWQAPPVPESWWETVRAETPAFDPKLSPTREMGVLAEYFRSLPGVQRSIHPNTSWSAQGPLAQAVTSVHDLNMGLNDSNPYGHSYANGALVMSIGTLRTSILHLSDYAADWPGKQSRKKGSALMVHGKREWREYDEIMTDGEDFEAIRQAYMEQSSDWSAGKVGYADTRLFPVRQLLDFAVTWIAENRNHLPLD